MKRHQSNSPKSFAYLCSAPSWTWWDKPSRWRSSFAGSPGNRCWSSRAGGAAAAAVGSCCPAEPWDSRGRPASDASERATGRIPSEFVSTEFKRLIPSPVALWCKWACWELARWQFRGSPGPSWSPRTSCSGPCRAAVRGWRCDGRAPRRPQSGSFPIGPSTSSVLGWTSLRAGRGKRNGGRDYILEFI